MRSKSWLLKITMMSVILGMLLAVSLKTQQQVRLEGGLPATTKETIEALREGKRQVKVLQEQVEEQQKKLTEYENQLVEGSSGGGMLGREIQDLRFQAGLTSVEGKGIIVTLKDSPQKVAADVPSIDLLIHDSDIRNFINELVAAGAEAISVNDQRIVFRSAIRCVGPVIQVNDTEIVAPYEIKAIGDPRTLEGGLRLPQGLVDSFPDTRMIEIKQEEHVLIKSYISGKPFKWAKPVEE